MSKPSSSEILAFKANEEEELRMSELLSKGKAHLTFDEQFEMEEMLRANHLISMAKIQAYQEFQSQVAA